MNAPAELFNSIRRKAGPLSQEQVDNISFLFNYLNTVARYGKITPAQRAYIFATIHHETNVAPGPFVAIKEKKANPLKQPRLWAMQKRYWGTGFEGKGAIQLTWEANYAKASEILEECGRNQDCVRNPNLMLNWPNSVVVAVDGMLRGWFTGKALDRYIKDTNNADLFNARRVVNGTFAAKEVAALAEFYEGKV